jgi:hypothetical protein
MPRKMQLTKVVSGAANAVLSPTDLGNQLSFHKGSGDGGNHHHHHKPLPSEVAAGFAAEHSLSEETKQALTKLIETVEHNSGEHAAHHHEAPRLQFWPLVEANQEWGEPTPELHADFESLFLDLVFVGVAFSLGDMLKHAFYLCDPPGGHGHSAGGHPGGHATGGHSSGGHATGGHTGGHASGSEVIGHGSLLAGSGSGSHNSSAGRLLSAAAHHDPCVGLADGVLHIFVFFLALFNLWIMDAIFDSHYSASGLLHNLLELLFLFSTICAASAIEDVYKTQRFGLHWWWYAYLLTSHSLTHSLTHSLAC